MEKSDFFMKKSFCLLLILLSIHIAFAQNPVNQNVIPQTETGIDKKLLELKTTPSADPKQTEKILLQLKANSEELDYIAGILNSGKALMRLYGSQSRDKEVVDLGNQLKKIAQNRKQKDTDGAVSAIYRQNALSLGMLGLDEASYKDFKTAFKTAKDIENSDSKQYFLSLCYENITGYYRSKQFKDEKYGDSVKYYLNKSLEVGKKIKNDNAVVSNQLKYDNIAFINIRLGIFYLEKVDIKGSLALAEKHLLEALKIYENNPSNLLPDNRTMLMNQLSWLYEEKKDHKASVDFANRALELEKLHPDPYHRVESYEFLASSYLEMGEQEKSKVYMAKYTHLKDSINMINRSAANATMTEMVAQVDDEHKTNRRKLLIWSVVIFLVIALVTLFAWSRKSRIMRRNYEQIVRKLKNEIPNKPTINEEEIDPSDDDTPIEPETSEESEVASGKTIISTETESRILKRLVTFERSERFLKKDLTIGLLSGQLNTNSKYLSEVIKIHRAQSFSHYINNLRINYIVHKLYNEPKYREYKITYLAEECGYASSQVFVIAFKKINGVTPSYYIENLKTDRLNLESILE